MGRCGQSSRKILAKRKSGLTVESLSTGEKDMKPTRTDHFAMYGELASLLSLLKSDLDGENVFVDDRSRFLFTAELIGRAQELIRLSAPDTYNKDGL